MRTRQQETLQIEGMSCGHCVKAVDQALRQLPGVEVEQVEIGTARIAYDPDQTSRQQLVDAVEDEGFAVR